VYNIRDIVIMIRKVIREQQRKSSVHQALLLTYYGTTCINIGRWALGDFTYCTLVITIKVEMYGTILFSTLYYAY